MAKGEAMKIITNDFMALLLLAMGEEDREKQLRRMAKYFGFDEEEYLDAWRPTIDGCLARNGVVNGGV